MKSRPRRTMQKAAARGSGAGAGAGAGAAAVPASPGSMSPAPPSSPSLWLGRGKDTGDLASWLHGSDPSVLALLLTDLPGLAPANKMLADVEAAMVDPHGEAWVARLLRAGSAETGTWGDAKQLYTPKWTSTHFTLQLLAQLRCPRNNEQVRICMVCACARAASRVTTLCCAWFRLVEAQHCYWTHFTTHATVAPSCSQSAVEVRVCTHRFTVQRNAASPPHWSLCAESTQGGRTSKKPKALVSELCITGMALFIASYFRVKDKRLQDLVRCIARMRTPDGGWNCRVRSSKTVHGSFHTTISCLEGLLEYQRGYGDTVPAPEGEIRVQDLLDSGHEFLLAHSLYKSHRTGEVAHPHFTQVAVPPRWKCDILRALRHFAAADVWDARLTDAFKLLLSKRKASRPRSVKGRLSGKHQRSSKGKGNDTPLAAAPPRAVAGGVKAQQVASSAIQPVRHALLRPEKPITASQYPLDGEPSAGHFAVRHGDELVAVGSIFQDPRPDSRDPTHAWRIRGMACRASQRGRGLGRVVLAALLQHARTHGGTTVWCNSRLPAAGFYRHCGGFAQVGEPFELHGHGTRVVLEAKLDAPRTSPADDDVGVWGVDRVQAGKAWFTLEPGSTRESRLVTVQALAVVQW